MNKQRKIEVINAARSFENIVREREHIYKQALECKRKGQDEEAALHVLTFYKTNDRYRHAERLIAERIYGDQDYVQVDKVIYKAYDVDTIARISLDTVINLTDTSGEESEHKKQ